MNTGVVGQIQNYGAEFRPLKDDLLESLKSQIAHVREQAQALSQDREIDAEQRSARRNTLQEQLRELGRQMAQRKESLRSGHTYSRREETSGVDLQSMQNTLEASKSTASTDTTVSQRDGGRPMFYDRLALAKTGGEFMQWPPQRGYAPIDVAL